MTPDAVVDIARDMLWIVIKTSAPMLVVSLVVGLIISVFQTITSIQEQTLTFVPKLLAIFLVIIVAGNWIMGTITEFTQRLFQFSSYIN